MSKYEAVPVHAIRVKPELQSRCQEDEDHVEDIARAYAAWQAGGCPDPCPVEPPVVYLVGKVKVLSAGFHRVAAAKKAGLEELRCEVRVGTEREAHLNSLRSNRGHKDLKPSRKDKKHAALQLYALLPKNAGSSAIADEVGVDRTTVERWLRAENPERSAQPERVDKNGKARVRGNQHTAAPPAPPAPPESLFDTPTHDPEPDGGGVAESNTTVQSTLSGADASPERKRDEYPPDHRFMPHAEEAERIAMVFRQCKARLEGVRATLRETLGDAASPMAKRVQFQGVFDGDLSNLITTLGDNLPEHVCPSCVGTGSWVDGVKCRHCDGYGMVSRTHADALKAKWKETGDRYERHLRDVDLSEAMQTTEA